MSQTKGRMENGEDWSSILSIFHGSVSGSSGSHRLRDGKTSSWVMSKRRNFGTQLEEIMDDRPNIIEDKNEPCSSTYIYAKSKNFAVLMLTIASTQGKSTESLKLDATVFLPCRVSALWQRGGGNSKVSTYLNDTLFFNLCSCVFCFSDSEQPKLVFDEISGNLLD